jgi:hypothetical protein
MGFWKNVVDGVTAGIATGGNGTVIDAYTASQKPEGERGLGDRIAQERGLMQGLVFQPNRKDGKGGFFGF